LPVIGLNLGPYRILEKLGAGGMGEVYKARDTRLDRSVAIKILPSDVAGDADRRARFEREARAVAALDHPHICGIYDVGSVDGTHYLVMPHLEGQTLAARLEKGPLPLDQALKIAGEIADALDKAHRQGIIHRDLKPANIMLTKAGVKLLDFGLAKLRTTAGPISMSGMTELATRAAQETADGMILGTVPYMAPEQVEGREADGRSDIWGLGAVIYEMVTGTRAFQGDTPASVIGAILKDNPPPVSRARPLTPPFLDQIVAQCLAKDPDDRWQSARDLQTALRWIGEPTQSTSRRSVSSARWAAIVVALLASGGVLGWFIASVRAPVTSPRAFSLEIGPPAGGELDFSILSGGSAISPDGKTVAFVAKVGGVSRLWLRPLDSITSQELRDTDDAQFPFWSPDGRSLAYFARGYLRRIDAMGGASTPLTAVSNPRGGSWSEDGTIVFSESVGPLQKIRASEGTRSSLTTLAAGEVSHRWPRFLPGGRTLFFFVQGERPGVYLTALDRIEQTQRIADASVDAAYVRPRDSGPAYVLMVQGDSLVVQPFDVDSMRITGPAVPIPGAGNALTFTGASRSNLSVANDGTVVYAAGSNRYQLTWFGEDGTTLRNVGLPDRYVGLRLSPDDTAALTFVDDSVGNRDIWRVELMRDGRNKLTSDNRGGYGTWSPNGQRIAFTGLTRQTVFAKSASSDAGNQVLLKSEYPVYPSDWSRDGKLLLYTLNSPARQFDVWQLPLEGASKAMPLLQSSAAEMNAGFSPDGQFIAFTSNESGRDEVYIQHIHDATTRKQVSTSGGGYPRWSRKGNELFFRSLDGQLVKVPVRINGTSTDVGDPRFVMRLIQPPTVLTYPYDIASDGRILAMTPVSGAASDISLTVLVDWHAALRR
jgi:serine/threonine protein kinase